MLSLLKNSFYFGQQLFTLSFKTQMFFLWLENSWLLKIERLYIPGIIYPVGAKVIIWRVCWGTKGKSTLTITMSAGI
jgi:hypothetical protein